MNLGIWVLMRMVLVVLGERNEVGDVDWVYCVNIMSDDLLLGQYGRWMVLRTQHRGLDPQGSGRIGYRGRCMSTIRELILCSYPKSRTGTFSRFNVRGDKIPRYHLHSFVLSWFSSHHQRSCNIRPG